MVPYLEQRSLVLRNMRARGDSRNVHHRDQWRSRSRHFTGVQRTIRHHAIQRTANLRIAELRARTFILSLRGGELALQTLEFLFMDDRIQSIQVAFCKFILRLRLCEADGRLVQILARQGPLLEQLQTAVIQFLCRVELFFGGLRVAGGFL